MVLIAVIVGYLLGVLPYVIPKVADLLQEKKTVKSETDKSKEQEEIFKEWLNGPQEAVNQEAVNQEDIYNEYITGKETAGKGAN